jgi:hypothetical protein|tara:strand:+ start:549 stop:650 length:102 start_codon:yes stop_codon:yes gene_type:complete
MSGIAAMDKHLRFNDPGVYCKFMGMPAGCPIHN